ncbi:MAG: ABC transporter ATP-binding protein [Desulfovibrionaceae bacterium]
MTASAMTGPMLLDCEGVTVRFGGVTALDGVTFQVAPGSITAIIGPNGAGKTTLLNAITGLVRTNAGSIRLDGGEISGKPPYRRARAGVVRTFQNLEIFTNMTVLENVMTGCHRRVRYSLFAALFKTPGYFAAERACVDSAMRHLAFVGLDDLAHTPAGDLPFGKQRLLELARAVAAEPSLLLLDEPAAGLNMKETRVLGRIIRRVRDELGITIALVEHDMDLIMDISDRITVLHFGTVLATGTPLEIQKNPEVVAAYLGEDDDAPASAAMTEDAEAPA